MYIHFLHIASTLGKNIHTHIYKSISTHNKLYSQRFYPRVLIIQREFFISVITIGYIYPMFISKLMFFSSNKAFSYRRTLLQTTLVFFFIMDDHTDYTKPRIYPTILNLTIDLSMARLASFFFNTYGYMIEIKMSR